MELVIQQRQELKMLMTVQLRQSIELLQYSNDDLEQFIRQQELENPLIELQEKADDQYVEKLPMYTFSNHSRKETTDITYKDEIDFRDYLYKLVKLNFNDDYIQKQLKYIIYNLNDQGYFQTDYIHTTSETKEITEGIQLLQQIGPSGIGARTLEECLTLQARDRYPEHQQLTILINEHLSLLADKKWQVIANKMHISLSEIKECNDLIKTLNPKPCAVMSHETTEYLRPDIIVEEHNHQLLFHLNDTYLPNIQLNSFYMNLPTANRDEKKYINEHYKNYNWLVNSIEQRRNTIIKIMQVLLEKQQEFFLKGFSALQPLTLKEVAEAIEMHESTVSRATTNKFVQTPIGTFELKNLFTSKLETKDGHTISQERVKTLLQELIAEENKIKPYSDQKMAEYFNSEYGITISRRTINKYREEMRIPSASKRKEL
ncbi:RNA polymerase factor sigma-54 [Viridibacillus arvi]|uniref:RNA polymerase factor sigma-54 n=1 Tax=Viridibacillus arvi TaxID=263475 RepID=UPI003D2903EA